MFCYQCQETAKNEGCTVKGMCGKTGETADLQDLLIYALRGFAVYAEKAKELGISVKKDGLFVAQALFATITNANFYDARMVALIQETIVLETGVRFPLEPLPATPEAPPVILGSPAGGDPLLADPATAPVEYDRLIGDRFDDFLFAFRSGYLVSHCHPDAFGSK